MDRTEILSTAAKQLLTIIQNTSTETRDTLGKTLAEFWQRDEHLARQK